MLTKLDGIAMTDKDKEKIKNELINLNYHFVKDMLRNSNKSKSEVSK